MAAGEVLDDAVGVADRLALGDENGDDALAGERVHLGAVALARRDAHRLVVDPVAAQLARDASAGAEPVGWRAAAVEGGHRRSTGPVCPPARRPAAARPRPHAAPTAGAPPAAAAGAARARGTRRSSSPACPRDARAST